MDQKYDGPAPKAQIRLTGRRVTRTEVTNDWGLQLRWLVTRDGKQVAAVNARPETTYEHPDQSPGTYEIVLQMWKYVDYAKRADGEFTKSKFVDVSEKVSYEVPDPNFGD